MPLLNISSENAFSNVKANPFSSWPNRRAGDNRVEPIATPNFLPSFEFDLRDSVFTIGSCFARNVEARLQSLGFDVPMRDLKIVEGPVHSGSDNPNIFNNYAVPSILNELQWALDASTPFDPATGFVEVTEDGYADLHLTKLFRPVSFEEACARRDRIKASMSSVTRCRIVIITLGLVEVWYDRLAAKHLNIAPPKQIAKRFPDRFELQVLCYEDVADRLRAIICLLKETSQVADQKIIITVSPIPLAQTFTDKDVMVANTYAKSVLRAAAESVCQRYGNVDYYPSYESIMLSDRHSVWLDDMRHVTAEIISLNVDRMIEGYCKVQSKDQRLQSGLSLEKDKMWESALKIFAQCSESGDRDALKGVLRCLPFTKRRTEVPSWIEKALVDDPSELDLLVECSKAARRVKSEASFQRTVPLLQRIGTIPAYREILQGVSDLCTTTSAQALIETARSAHPRFFLSYQVEAKIELGRGNLDKAEELLRSAIDLTPNSAICFSMLGNILSARKAYSEAREAYNRAIALNPDFGPALEGLAQLNVPQ